MSDDDSDEEIYSITSSQAVYKRSRSRSSTVVKRPDRKPLPKLIVANVDDSSAYLPVTKWAVDYNNKNYIRSQCNKNIGLHRKSKGRPHDWQIEYDNHYHVRSKVNSPKGLHRKTLEVKRKYAPDDDDLADARGWEFDCGPEYDQEEQDVLFIPEGRIISRGCYRWYGVKRNDSDCDVKQEEHRENLLNEQLEAELKYGAEFFQSDKPHMSERHNRKFSRGGYRYYEVPRNVYDIKPEELATAGKDPEWRRKHHISGIENLETEMCDYDQLEDSGRRVVRGKPFKRTILNKVYELRKRVDSRESVARHATRLSLVPGEGRRSMYEGIPDRFPFAKKRSPEIRNIFKKKSERHRYETREGDEYEEYERENTHQYREMRPEHEDRLHRLADERRRSHGRPSHYEEDEIRRRSHGRPSHYEEDEMRHRPSGSRRTQEYSYEVKTEEEPGLRRSLSERESLKDGREEFETWRENVENSRREWEDDAGRTWDIRPVDRRRTQEYASRNKDEPGSRKPRSASMNSGGPRDVREEFETWRENAENSRREWEMDAYRKGDKRSTGRKAEEALRDDDYAPREKGASTSRRERAENEYRVKERTSKEKRDIVVERSSSRGEEYDYGERRWHGRKDRSAGGYTFEEKKPKKDKVRKKLPPHVEKRMREIEEKMERKFERLDQKLNGEREGLRECRSADSIDLMKHKDHPRDKGHSHSSEYEKYVTKNGSEYWVKKEENYSELHHKDSR